MNFTIDNVRTDNYDNVVRLFCHNSKGHKIEIDVHKIFYSLLNNEFKMTIEHEKKDHDCVMSGIVINKKLLSFHGLLLSLEKEMPELLDDSKIYCGLDRI